MATGIGPGSVSIGKGSTIFYDFSCSPCSKEGENVEAIQYCVECDESLCSTCLKVHSRFEIMREHQLLDDVPTTAKGQQGGSPVHDDVPTTAKEEGGSPHPPEQKCPIHQSKTIDMYCGTHDEVCCDTCIAISHRPCQDLGYIPDLANSLRKGKEFENAKLAIDRVKSGIAQLKKRRRADLDIIEQQKRHILTQIKDYRDSINQQLDDMEKITKDELQTRCKKFEDQIKADLKEFTEMLSRLETKASELRTFGGDNESQLFVYVKQSKVTTKEGDTLMNKIKSVVGKETLQFVVNSETIDTLCNIGSLGALLDYKLNRYNVKVSSDTSVCSIVDSCILGDGSILITDQDNEKLKQLDQSYKVIAECRLPCEATAVCQTGPSEVAMTLINDKKVQFATVTDKITLTRSFPVGDRCRGLAYSEDELFVSCGGWENGKEGPGQVKVYTTQGTLLRSIQKDSNGQHLFSIPFHVTVSLCGKRIHIADHNSQVITMDRDGNKLHVFTDPELDYAIGVCVMDDDSVLVLGYKSHTVLQIGAAGKKKAVVLQKKDGIKYPRSLQYDRKNTKLLVTTDDTDHINVYDMYSGF